jgi:hypothetical protein
MLCLFCLEDRWKIAGDTATAHRQVQAQPADADARFGLSQALAGH